MLQDRKAQNSPVPTKHRTCAMSDIEAGEGVTIIDPHRDLAESIIDCIAGRTVFWKLDCYDRDLNLRTTPCLVAASGGKGGMHI